MSEKEDYTKDKGETGPQGPEGPEGPGGPIGPEGPAGTDGAAGTMGLFEVDISGGLMPITETEFDDNFELDGSDDIMPKTA